MKQLTPLAIVIISIAIFFIFTDKTYTDAEVLKIQRDKNEETLEDARKLDVKVGELRQRFNAISNEDKDRLLKVLPNTVDNVRLVRDIDRIAQNNGVFVEDIEIVGEEEGDFGNEPITEDTVNGVVVGNISLSFSLVSGYSDFINFMKDLETALRLVDVRGYEIETDSSEENPSLFKRYNVSLVTYWLR